MPGREASIPGHGKGSGKRQQALAKREQGEPRARLKPPASSFCDIVPEGLPSAAPKHSDEKRWRKAEERG